MSAALTPEAASRAVLSLPVCGSSGGVCPPVSRGGAV